MADERLSNVIGAPFPEHVLTQLNIRAAHNSTGTGAVPKRSNEEILFLANKTSWVKLTSSVRIQPTTEQTITQFYQLLGLGSDYAKPDDLAKNWILSAGTSQADRSGVNLRSGLGPNGAYGLGGIGEMGYRPMPGLTSVTIETQGTLGSLRQATINFQVWNINQLNIIEALYFRLGYSMLLEWGHTQFFTNKRPGGESLGGTFTTSTYGIDPFVAARKEVVQQNIAKRAKELSGNYDGMLGIVTNFNYSFNQEGGYDCNIKLTGLGAIIDSMRINLSYKMPNAVFQNYQQQQQTLEDDRKKKEAQAQKDAEQRQRTAGGTQPTLPATPTNAQQIYTNIFTADIGTGLVPIEKEAGFLQKIGVPAATVFDNVTVNSQPDYYYKASRGGNPPLSNFITELNTKRTGLFLSSVGTRAWQLVVADQPPPVSLNPSLLDAAIEHIDMVLRSLGAGTYKQNDFEKALGTSPFVKFYDLLIRDSKQNTLSSVINSIDNVNVDPDELIYQVFNTSALANIADIVTAELGFSLQSFTDGIKMLIPYKALVKNPQTGNTVNKTFYISLNYQPAFYNTNNPQVEQNRLTRQEFTDCLQKWYNDGAKISVKSLVNTVENGINSVVVNSVVVSGTLVTTEVASTNKSGIAVTKTAPVITIEFNNTGLIQTVNPPTIQQQQPTPAAGQASNTGNDSGTENQVSTEQIDEAQRFASALHAMLAAVKSTVQVKALSINPSQGVFQALILDLTEKLSAEGVLSEISKVKLGNPTAFNLKQYALKGFNSNLMADASRFSDAKIPLVDFQKLCTAYGIRYTIKDEQGTLNFPIYIKFGYLLAFLNSMCLIYDSTQDTDKHPYVYLDFNPETNYCLTSPQHLSVDPFTCMIPFQGSNEDYLKIFPSELRGSLQDPLGKTTNAVSGYLNSFKTLNNPYQGKIMEILLNVDFLIQTLDQFSTNDREHSVNLRGFLDAIVSGINKSTGNFNLFRVAYRDDSNTVIIKDDQFVPPDADEAYMIDRQKYLSIGPNNKPKYGQLPVFRLQSLVRKMEFKTNLSTKISSKIAISAQAQTGSANSSDYSPFSYLNVNYVDFYKTKVGNLTDKVVVASTGSNDLNQAQQFNTLVKSIYYGGKPLSRARIGPAINYYIDQLANRKATDVITSAAPFIPANLSITIDGISGIVMGNAFTIPEDRLPLSLKGSADQTKVGFIVVGLTHTLDNNEWLTKIRGQMIKLRDSTSYGALEAITKIQTSFPAVEGESVGADSGCKTSYPELTPLLTSIQVDFLPITRAASYLKTNYPDVGKAVFAIIQAEAGKSGDSFRSAGGNNFGGVQTDSGRWGFGNFSGQFCRRDSGGVSRMFAVFPTPEAFLDFLATRIKAKGFTSNASPDDWTTRYINDWWSPAEKASYTKGSATYINKLSIYNSAAAKYDQA